MLSTIDLNFLLDRQILEVLNALGNICDDTVLTICFYLFFL